MFCCSPVSSIVLASLVVGHLNVCDVAEDVSMLQRAVVLTIVVRILHAEKDLIPIVGHQIVEDLLSSFPTLGLVLGHSVFVSFAKSWTGTQACL